MDEQGARPNVHTTGVVPIVATGPQHYQLGNAAMHRDYRTSTVLRHGDVFRIVPSHVDVEVLCPPPGVTVEIHLQPPARPAPQRPAADEDEGVEAAEENVARDEGSETRRLVSLSRDDFALLGHAGHALRLSRLVTLGSLDALRGFTISVTQAPAPAAAPPLPPPLVTVLWTELNTDGFNAVRQAAEHDRRGPWPSLRLTLPHVVRGFRLVRFGLLHAKDRGYTGYIRPQHAAYTYVADLDVHHRVLEPVLDGLRVVAREGEAQVAQLAGFGQCMAEVAFVRGASMDAEVSDLQPFVNPASGLLAAADAADNITSAGLPTRCTGRALSRAPGSTDGGRPAMGCIAANRIDFFQLAVQMAQPMGDAVDVDLVVWRPAAVEVREGLPRWSVKLGHWGQELVWDENGALRRVHRQPGEEPLYVNDHL